MFDKMKQTVGIDKKDDKKAGEEAGDNDKSGNEQPKTNTSAFDQFKSIANDKINDKINDAKDAADKAKNFADGIGSMGMEAIKPFREKINKWVHQQIENGVVRALEALRPHAKKSLKDPDMFECEKYWVDEIVDQNWPDLVDEARFRLKMAQQKPYIEVPKKKRCCLIQAMMWFRAQYLYSTLPYDQTFFKQRKNPFFWFFTILKAFPYFGVQPIMYTFIFMCIDKSDEFQLVKYILDFKKMQFITQGAMQGVIGYVKYFFCASYVNKSDLDDIADKCIDEGPGSDMIFYYDLFVYCLQVLLIWLAYCMLPCSKQKGKPKFKYDDSGNKVVDAVEPGCCKIDCKRGGLLQVMLLWDILSFGIGTFAYIFTFTNNPLNKNWQDSTPFLFFGKWLYGMLSLPFIFFGVPIVKNLLTKCKPTAYDRYGNTVPHKTDIDIDYDDEEEAPLAKPDINNLFSGAEDPENIQQKEKEKGGLV